MAKHPSKKNKEISAIPPEMPTEFVSNIDFDEIRCSFLVTSHRKKLWNAQIELINEFARICAKHNLHWYAFGGTLLGAARHKGYIPWDDDVDLMMWRPDYEKFKKVAAEEIKPPYFLDHWYDYRLEEDAKTLPEESDLPLITREDKKKNIGYWPFVPMIKIRDSRTTMIEVQGRKNTHQGIWIDIFPLDPVPPFEDKAQEKNFIIECGLLRAIITPEVTREILAEDFAKDEKFSADVEFLKNFLSLTYREKAMFLENFMSENFTAAPYFGQIYNHCISQNFARYKAENLSGLVYLPFEKIQVPAPVNYAGFLQDYYGDWRKMIFSKSHTKYWSTDIPYDVYFKNVSD